MLLDNTTPAQDTAADRRMAAIDRLRAAVARLEVENRDLQAEVGDFKAAIDGLGNRVVALEATAEEYRLGVYAIRVSALRRSAQRLGETADNWLDRCADTGGDGVKAKVKTAA